MKFDTIIIGGGLSGMTAAITLAKAGKKVAVINRAQNTLHFNSGSFDLLGYDAAGNPVTNPLEAIKQLPETHPYAKIGAANIEALAAEAKQFLADAGIATYGQAKANHQRLTPIGALKPAWLTLDGFVHTDEAGKLPAKSVDIVNIEGYLDLPVDLLADGLQKAGLEVAVRTITTPALEQARRSPSEMRASNIALVLANADERQQVAEAINAIDSKAELLLLPAVLGYKNQADVDELVELVHKPMQYVATLPPSVPGIRITYQLRKQLQALGGTFIASDPVVKANYEGGRLVSVETEKLAGTKFEAQNFILATGSFVSHGLVSNYESVSEPALGLDVYAPGTHKDWSVDYLFDAQPYMEFGVLTDSTFHALKDGKPLPNVYAIGSVLSGHNSIKQADGTGVSLLTALAVAKQLK